MVTSVSSQLKKLLITAVPETFIKTKRDEFFGYANVTVLQLLDHLDATYGTVTAADLTKNTEAMEKEWSTTQPLEDLWNQITICQAFAKDHDPISERAAIRSACNNLSFCCGNLDISTNDDELMRYLNYEMIAGIG